MSIQTDVVIIGAGPCGLFQVFELGLLDIRCHVIDSLPQVGGQCTELYPDKPIYDIPALPVVSGQELADRLVEQIQPFDAPLHLGQTVNGLERREDGRFTVTTSSGETFDAAAVIIAAGLGAFQPRKLKAEGTDRWEGSHIHYRIKNPSELEGKDIVMLGGGDSALDWVLEMHDRVNSLTLVHRRPDYRAAPASVSKMKELAAAGVIREMQGQARQVIEEDGQFKGLRVVRSDGETEELAADAAYVFYGLSPNLGPIADWGLDLDKRQLRVDTEKFETSEPGIYAVGDINTYPGKKKLILSGFHEAALAAFAIKHQLNPEKKVHLQYTTTSPVMHERLGVEGE